MLTFLIPGFETGNIVRVKNNSANSSLVAFVYGSGNNSIDEITRRIKNCGVKIEEDNVKKLCEKIKQLKIYDAIYLFSYVTGRYSNNSMLLMKTTDFDFILCQVNSVSVYVKDIEKDVIMETFFKGDCFFMNSCKKIKVYENRKMIFHFDKIKKSMEIKEIVDDDTARFINETIQEYLPNEKIALYKIEGSYIPLSI